MGFGFLLILQLKLLVFLMPTGQGVLMIGKVHPGGIFTLGIIWFPGIVKSKMPSLFRLLRLSTLLQGVVVHKCCR